MVVLLGPVLQNVFKLYSSLLSFLKAIKAVVSDVEKKGMEGKKSKQIYIDKTGSKVTSTLYVSHSVTCVFVYSGILECLGVFVLQTISNVRNSAAVEVSPEWPDERDVEFLSDTPNNLQLYIIFNRLLIDLLTTGTSAYLMVYSH